MPIPTSRQYNYSLKTSTYTLLACSSCPDKCAAYPEELTCSVSRSCHPVWTGGKQIQYLKLCLWITTYLCQSSLRRTYALLVYVSKFGSQLLPLNWSRTAVLLGHHAVCMRKIVQSKCEPWTSLRRSLHLTPIPRNDQCCPNTRPLSQQWTCRKATSKKYPNPSDK